MQRPPRNKRPEPRLKTILGEGLPYSFSVVVCDLYQRLDQFLILWLSSFVTQGLYAAAVPAAGMLMVGTNALSLFSFNAGSRRQELITIKQVFLAGALVAAFQMILAILLALAIGPLIILFYGREFAGAIPFALALIPAHSINGFAQVAEGHLRGRGKIQVGIWARMGAAIVMVVTVSIAFGRLAEMSIPIAVTLAHGFVAVILAWFTIADLGQQKRKAPNKSRIELP